MSDCITSYALPFEPYGVQAEMTRTITHCLQSAHPPVPVAAVEVPTGCGKTLALLSSVLRYQASLEKMTPLELEGHLREREWRRPLNGQNQSAAISTRVCEGAVPEETNSVGTKDGNPSGHDSSNDNNSLRVKDSEEGWRASPLFFKQFRAQNVRRLRVEMDNTSADLRHHHDPPPCTIFYITRTHAQVRQAVGELRKLQGLNRLKMNILGSRERYCINPTVIKARANKTLPVEGNNLGEVCDKLVSLGQCEAVHGYGSLASKVIGFPICRGKSDKVWDMEDLVAEGVATQSCPYYAARDLVFFAHLTFATYQYLLDPLIRHECKMEAALRNHSIVVFDEAHNVSLVCQDALSLETSVESLQLVLNEIEPLVAGGDTTSFREGVALSYPREFKLTHWTLGELFSLLFDVFRSILVFVGSQGDTVNPHDRSKGRVDVSDDTRGPTIPGMSLRDIICRCIEDYIPIAIDPSEASVGTAMFRQVYGITMSLGVTFNPFNFTVFGLSIMKRWLLVMRFLLQKPQAFVISIRDEIFSDGARDATLSKSRRSVGIRCLDGGLGFHHLLNSTHRIILASGTLVPFDQLARDINLLPSQVLTFEGSHVVEAHQYRLAALTHLYDASRLHCTYGNLSDVSFITKLTAVIAMLANQVPIGGVLVFLPNYSVMRVVAGRITAHYKEVNNANAHEMKRAPEVFMDPKAAADFSTVLDTFRAVTNCRTAILVSVYRGKVSEGIDFADNMARLVVCVGIPLQPLKSWTVVAQRQYSGEEWYTTDALRAVNQALGRCLRHRNDYGAVVLLDDRFGQQSNSGRLSKWCRQSLIMHSSPDALGKELSAFYKTNMRALKIESKIKKEKKEVEGHNHSKKVPANAESLVSAAALLPLTNDSFKESTRPRITTRTHEWSCTAVKLLYESSETVEHVAAADLREKIRLLEDEYLN